MHCITCQHMRTGGITSPLGAPAPLPSPNGVGGWVRLRLVFGRALPRLASALACGLCGGLFGASFGVVFGLCRFLLGGAASITVTSSWFPWALFSST